MRIITGSQLRPSITPFHAPNPLQCAVTWVRNISRQLSSFQGYDINMLPSQKWRAFLRDILTYKASEALVQLHQNRVNLLLAPVISSEIRPLLVPVITLSSALTLNQLNRSRQLKALWRLFITYSQANLLRALLVQPVLLLTASSETKTLLYQLTSSLINPLIYARSNLSQRLIALITELPSIYFTVQQYRDIPLNLSLYSLAEWLESWLTADGMTAINSADIRAVCVLLGCLALLRNSGLHHSPASSLMTPVYSLVARLIEMQQHILHNKPAAFRPKVINAQLEFISSTPPLLPKPPIHNAAARQANVPLLASAVVAANTGWQSRQLNNPLRPAGIVIALSTSALLLTYGGFKLGISLLHGLSALSSKDQPIKINEALSASRNKKATLVPTLRTLHISSFTPQSEISLPILAATRQFLLTESSYNSSDGIALIAALADRLFDSKLEFQFPQLDLLFAYLKQAGRFEEIGLSGHKSGINSEGELIIWSGDDAFDLAQDISRGKISRPELRDAVALFMHLILRASGTEFPIINSLNEVKYRAVGLYYQWYVNNRLTYPVLNNYPKPSDLTMRGFYDRLAHMLTSAIALFNPHQVDVTRLIHFLIYLEMPNVAIGILFANGSGPAICKQNSYAIHADIALKNRGDELRVDNYLSTIEEVKNEDIRIINLITHSEIFAAIFAKQSFIAEIHRMVFNTEYELAKIENKIHQLGYIDRMAMISVVVSELGAQQRVAWTAKRTIPSPGKLSKEQAFTRIHNYYKQRESLSGRTGAVIPHSHMIAIERHRNWLEQYIALSGNLTVMLEVDPQVFDNFTKNNPTKDIRRTLQQMMPLASINQLFNTKYDGDLSRERKLIRQSLEKSLTLLSQQQRNVIDNADSYRVINLVKYAHTIESTFAQPEGERREIFSSWRLASLVMTQQADTLSLFSFNRRYYLKHLTGDLITTLPVCCQAGSLANTLSCLLHYMTANHQRFIDTNTHQRCAIPSWAITGYSYELDTQYYTNKEQMLEQLCRDNLQPRQDMKYRAFSETAEERELAQDIRWLALRPWLPFVECYDFSSGLAHGKETFLITTLDGLTCGLNFIPAGKIVAAPFKLIIKGVQKISHPGKAAMKTAVMHSVDHFFSGPIPGVSAESLSEFRRLYKNIYSDEIFQMSETGLSEILIDGIYTFVSRGSPIPLPNIFKWNVKMMFHAITNMNKGFLLKTIVQGVKSNAAPAMGFIGEKIAPKVFRSVRRKYQSSMNALLDESTLEIIDMISDPERYLPYNIDFNEQRCTFNRLRLQCELSDYRQISPVKQGPEDIGEQLAIRRVLHQKLLLSLFQSDNPVYWHRSLQNVSVDMQINGEFVRRTVSFIRVDSHLDATLAYLKAFYVTLWDQDFDDLLLMIKPEIMPLKPADVLNLVIAKVEAGKNSLILPPDSQWVNHPQSASLQILIDELAYNIRGASYLPDFTDDYISSRYLANLLSQLAFFSVKDWDRNFVITRLTVRVREEKIFIGNVTDALLHPFIQQLVQALTRALDIKMLDNNGADCFYRTPKNTDLNQAYRAYQRDLAGRLPTLFINTRYSDFLRQRDGRPHSVPSGLWALMTADEHFLRVRQQIHRLVYRHYDRFMASYDYQQAIKREFPQNN